MQVLHCLPVAFLSFAILLFSPSDLPSGQVVRFLVAFRNGGDQDFLVESMDASFRYPQDYSFIIQNVSQRSK